MGLLIKLQNGDTALKSLKFGQDRPGGGNSGQPYIQNPIIESPGALGQWDNDFLLRGGLKAPISAAEDVARLTKYMFDFRSPKGLLFAAKQNLLSLTAPKTETSSPVHPINEGIYNPLSTIAQAGVGFAGIHIEKQGIDPTGLIPGLSPRSYSKVIEKQIIKDIREHKFEVDEGYDSIKSKNRLIDYYQTKQTLFHTDSLQTSNLNTYLGGPGSILGVGATNIKFATDNKGNPLRTIQTPKDLYNFWTIRDFLKEPKNNSHEIKQDFRIKVLNPSLPKSLGYNENNNIETNFNLGNPGQKGDVSDFTKGKILEGQTRSVATDKITAYPIYKSSNFSGVSNDSELNDLIPFNIAILNNENELGGPYKKFIHFRAFIDSFSDSYSADWAKIEYMGRAEKFYKYKGFDRDISLAFTVVAQSKDELSVMYDKLNFLASSLAPEYLDSGLSSGYMTGNIAYLTVGDYIIDQPGIITSLTFDIPEESPWEISIKNDGTPYSIDEKKSSYTSAGTISGDDYPRRLPHMIKVTGFKFIPIHTFRPEKVRWKNISKGTQGEHEMLTGNVKQKYIDPLKTATTPRYGDLSISSQSPTNTSFPLDNPTEGQINIDSTNNLAWGN